MNQRMPFILLTLLTINPAFADTPPIRVASEIQASRDNEKLDILQTELNGQLQLAAKLQQQRAVNLQSGKNEELTQTETRLNEVNENIKQIQQEIKLASGQPETAKAVSVRLTPLQKDAEKTKIRKENDQASNQQEPWWDLYHQRKKD